MAYDAFNIWSDAIDWTNVTPTELNNYAVEFGLTEKAPSDTKLANDIVVAKANAKAAGNTKLENTLDFIFKYGDKALSILTKNGIIKNQNLSTAGYSIDLDSLTKDTATSSAPAATNRVFNIDFSDPKVLIIVFLAIMAIVYFLFFNTKKNGRR